MSRWQQFESERRANLIRVGGILVFYVVELLNFYGMRLASFEWSRLEALTRDDHVRITAIAVAWAGMALIVLIAIRRQLFPTWMIFATVAGDLIFLTGILLVTDGAGSPLVVIYFLVLVLAATRFSLPLIRVATAVAAFGYLVLLGVAKWGGLGVRVPRHEQAIVLLALILSGVILGQAIRRARAIAEEFAERVEHAGTDPLVGEESAAESPTEP